MNPATGDRHAIEVRVAELRQIFNAIDPSPFRERDLDPRAEDFIVGWVRDLPASVSLALNVHLDRAPGPVDETAALQEAVHEFFGQRASAARRTLRDTFRRGRVSLTIGLAFLAGSIAIGDALVTAFATSHLAGVVRESLLIGGWVAMWRPLETFLYDWWPIRADIRLFDRLAAMPVHILYTPGAAPERWRDDWPAATRIHSPAAPDQAGGSPGSGSARISDT